MRRREFIALAGGAAAAWPLAARAQQPGKLPTIGFLGADAAGWRPWTDAFLKRLRELGWIDGQTIAIEYRWTEGHPERVAEIAAEFVRRKVDLIVAYGIAVPTLKQATAVIPIVFAIAQDPVGGGLVASLARPGGNVTGLSLQDSDVAGKRLELLREIVPSLRRLAILTNIGSPQAASETGEVHAAARKLGLEIVPLEIRRAEDIGPAFEGIEVSSRRTLRPGRSNLYRQSQSNHHACARRAAAGNLQRPRLCPRRGSHVLWTRLFGSIPTLCRVGRQNSARGETRRYPGRAADQIRAGDQSQDCQGAWPHRSAIAARHRRRGDRIRMFFAALHMSLSGPLLHLQRRRICRRLGAKRTTSGHRQSVAITQLGS